MYLIFSFVFFSSANFVAYTKEPDKTLKANRFDTEGNLEGKVKEGELSNQTGTLETVFWKHYVGWFGRETEVKDTS